MRKKKKRRNQPDCPSWWQHKDRCYEHHVQQGLYHVWHEFWANPKCSPLDTKLLLLDVFELKMILSFLNLWSPSLFYITAFSTSPTNDVTDRRFQVKKKKYKTVYVTKFHQILTKSTQFDFFVQPVTTVYNISLIYIYI